MDTSQALVPALPSAGYARQSHGSKKSISEQLRDYRVRAEEMAWADYGEFTDTVSASRMARKKRGDWEKLHQDVRLGKVKILWLWELTRGGRIAEDWQVFFRECAEHGVRIFLEDIGDGRLFDPADDTDWEILSTLAIKAEAESRKMARRLKRDAKYKALDGKPVGKVAYGWRREYDRETRKFARQVPDEEVREQFGPLSPAGVIRELNGWLYRGGSLRGIERELRQRGVLNPRTGKPFTFSHLRVLALTASYAGIRVHARISDREDASVYAHLRRHQVELKEDTDPQVWPRIIPQDRFWFVHGRLNESARKTAPPSRPGRAVHLASIIVRCAVCGGHLSARRACRALRDGSRPFEYFCQAHGHVSCLEAELDEALRERVLSYLLESGLAEQQAAQDADAGPELERIDAETASKQKELDDLPALVDAGEMSARLAGATEKQLTASMAELRARRRELTVPEAIREFWDHAERIAHEEAAVAERWDSMPLAARRRLLRELLVPEHMGALYLARRPTGVKGYPVEAILGQVLARLQRDLPGHLYREAARIIEAAGTRGKPVREWWAMVREAPDELVLPDFTRALELAQQARRYPVEDRLEWRRRPTAALPG